jgi:hypothetical protein
VRTTSNIRNNQNWTPSRCQPGDQPRLAFLDEHTTMAANESLSRSDEALPASESSIFDDAQIPASLQDILKSLEADQEKSKGPGSSLVKKLYEGESECKCCKNWIEDVPRNTNDGVDHKWLDAAILIRYGISHKNIVKKPFSIWSISIQNSILKNMVQDILKDFPGLDTDVQDLTLRGPLWPFFHRWQNLESMLKSETDEQKKSLLSGLHSLLEEELKEDIDRAGDLTSHGMIDYSLLWTIFSSGTPVLSGTGLTEQLGVVITCDYESDKDDNYWFQLEVAHLDYDGENHGWKTMKIKMPSFRSQRSIAELDVVPYRYLTEASSTIRKLNLRGQKAIEALRDGHKAYRGSTSWTEAIESSNPAPAAPDVYNPYQLYGNMFPSAKSSAVVETVHTEFSDGRIMVDASQHAKYATPIKVSAYPHGLRSLVPQNESCLQGFSSARGEKTHSGGSVTREDHHISFEKTSNGSTTNDERSEAAMTADPLWMQRWTMIVFGIASEAFCPPEVRGYCLTSKRWVSFKVDGISSIEWNDTAYDRLVIAAPRKRLLKALVEEHRHQKAQTDDMIRGKGQGLILLLNGPPGTGKTLTAEAIADKLHLPLYAIDASQLGDDIEKLEENLRTIFRIAGTWDVVVLLDEADAFLERRSSNPEHAERNKRVAIFLRVLEYFRGILILTSNRAVEFDDAFHSRIHLTLQYPDLDHLARIEVWTNILGMAPHALTTEEIGGFAKEEMNGRQIKNVIKMARLLAKSEGHTLNAADIRDVIGITKETQHL